MGWAVSKYFVNCLNLRSNNYVASTLGKVDKVALPPFEEHKLCQRTSHAQFQITLSTAALSYHTLEKSQITLRGTQIWRKVRLHWVLLLSSTTHWRKVRFDWWEVLLLSDLEKSQITLSNAALSYRTLEKSQIRLRGSTTALRLIWGVHCRSSCLWGFCGP